MIKILNYQNILIEKNFLTLVNLWVDPNRIFLLEALKKKYTQSDFKNLKILSIGPELKEKFLILFANGFEFKNITGIDLFSYSPGIQFRRYA